MVAWASWALVICHRREGWNGAAHTDPAWVLCNSRIGPREYLPKKNHRGNQKAFEPKFKHSNDVFIFVASFLIEKVI